MRFCSIYLLYIILRKAIKKDWVLEFAQIKDFFSKRVISNNGVESQQVGGDNRYSGGIDTWFHI